MDLAQQFALLQHVLVVTGHEIDDTVWLVDTPGHTPADITYKIEHAAFVGDTMFMPDYGTARADFPGGDAHQLYRSIRKLMSLPEATRLFMCHDYKAPGRDIYLWPQRPGDPVWNAANCRSRRIYVDRTAKASTAHDKPFLLQTYRRNMGDRFQLMKDISVPIRIGGRKWGVVRVGYTV